MSEPSVHDVPGYQVVEYEGDDPQWMFELLNNPSFAKVPPSQFQGLIERFRPLAVAAGEAVLKQGAPGDYYYLIRSGSARVTRTGHAGKEVVLAELGPGSGFGEEALLSGEPRNATVTMLASGLLMRLAADDFDALLRMPLVQGLSAAAAYEMLRLGALLVDVRQEEEFRRDSLPWAVNLPLFLLRIKAAQLDRLRPLLLFCDDGRRAATAAFLLSQMGFDTHILAGTLDEFRNLGQAPE